MILTTHMLAGGAIGRLVPQNPFLAFILGFLSHFVLDAIPHSQYELKSLTGKKSSLELDMVIDERFLRDLGMISLDFCLGATLSLAISGSSLSVVCGALGGILPDFLLFVYFKTKTFLLKPIQEFHVFLNRDNHFGMNSFWGISAQVLIMAIIVLFSKRFLTS